MLAKIIYARWLSMDREQRFKISADEVINDSKLYGIFCVVNVEADSQEDACEKIFEIFNSLKRQDFYESYPDADLTRSMSVGDLVLFQDGTAFLCAGAGWKKLPDAFDDFLFKII